MDRRQTTSKRRPFVTRANTRFTPTGFLIFILLIPFPPAYASNAETALEGMQRRYASVETISGSFRLTYSDQGIEQVESGEFWLKKPAFMRWEYRYPEEKLFIADGRETYFYEPLDRQVTVQSFTAEELLSTPLKFLLGAEGIDNSFVVEPEHEIGHESEGMVSVRLTPRSEAEYAFLVLEIDAATSGLRRLTIYEQSGDTLEYQFSDLKMNVKVSNEKFKFKIPDDTEVYRLDNNE